MHLLISNHMVERETAWKTAVTQAPSTEVSSCIFRTSNSLRSSVSFKSNRRISSSSSLSRRVSSLICLPAGDADFNATDSQGKTPYQDSADHSSDFIISFRDC